MEAAEAICSEEEQSHWIELSIKQYTNIKQLNWQERDSW